MKYSKHYWSKAERNKLWGGYLEYRNVAPKMSFENYLTFAAE
jgi:hypothetical protein